MHRTQKDQLQRQELLNEWKNLLKEGNQRWREGLDCYRQQCAAQIAVSRALTLGMPVSELEWWNPFAQEAPFNYIFDAKKNDGFGITPLTAPSPDGTFDSSRIICVTTFLHIKSVEHLVTPCWFSLSKGLFWGLHNTELKETYVEHVRMPFSSFFIALPPECVYLNDPLTGLHQARYIAVAEGFEPSWGRAICVGIYCEPNEKSAHVTDDHVMDTWIPLFDEKQPLDKVIDMTEHAGDVLKELLRRRPITEFRNQLTEEEKNEVMYEVERRVASKKRPEEDDFPDLFGYIFNEKYQGKDLKRAVLRIVANTLLYINSVSAYKKHIHEDEIDQLKAKALKAKKGMAAQRSRLLKHINELSKVSEWTLGTNITIDPMAIIHRKGPGHPSTGRKLSAPSITKGHWRHQAHGPGFSLRKLIWIAPFVRGQELGTPYGHKYEVKP